MGMYENIVKQCNIIMFVVNSEDMIVDTNIYTMGLLDMYDITGRHFYSLFDDMSQLKIKSCLMSGYFEPMEVNLLASSGDLKSITIVYNRINGYMVALGTVKNHKMESLLSQLEVMSYQAQSAGIGITASTGSPTEQEKRFWQLNNIDTLTGLYNKRFFNDRYEEKYGEAVSEGKNLGIILIDIDSFKELNEEHGPEKGNRILVGLSQIILACIRSGDYAVRYDNDEFLVMLGDIKDSPISLIAERIRERTEMELGITVSVGCTSICRTDEKDREGLLGKASEALRISKSQGRNRVTAL